jgi:hypothetical protein
MSWMPAVAWYVTPALLLFVVLTLNRLRRDFKPAPVRVQRPNAVPARSRALSH